MDAVWNKIRQDIPKAVSVGYSVQKYTEKTINGVLHRTAVSWTPMELSPEGIPADGDALFRECKRTFDYEIEIKEQAMSKREDEDKEKEEEREDSSTDEEDEEKEDRKGKRHFEPIAARINEIVDVCAIAGCNVALVRKYINSD